jgi:hypothetical protein
LVFYKLLQFCKFTTLTANNFTSTLESLDKHDISRSWQNSNIHVFWNDIAANRRSVQIYENERSFLLTLEGFAGSGLLANERVVVIAMREHLDQLHFHLQKQFAKLHTFIESRQYIPMDNADLMELITIDGQFSGDLLYDIIYNLLSDTIQFHHTRVYSEIAVMLLSGQMTEALQPLDHCWNKLHQQFTFSHFRAFPRDLLLADNTPLEFYNNDALLIQGDLGPSTEVSYQQFHPKVL